MSASVNPSDVKNVARAMRQTTLPRIPGRDFAGVVEAGPSGWIGAEVWGTGGDTGFTRDGTHAELIAVPVGSLRRKPKTLSFEEAASVGVNYMAAWCGIEAAGLKSAETVLLIGAGGGVGSAAAQIARRLGGRVIGADRRAPVQNAPVRAIAEKLIIGADDLPTEVRAATGGKGADVVLDLVGGVMFCSALKSLSLRGRLVEIASTGQREVSFDLVDFYHNESRLFGVDTHAQTRPDGVRGGPGCAHARIRCWRLPCRADRKDLRARWRTSSGHLKPSNSVVPRDPRRKRLYDLFARLYVFIARLYDFIVPLSGALCSSSLRSLPGEGARKENSPRAEISDRFDSGRRRVSSRRNAEPSEVAWFRRFRVRIG
jgi:NADPH:quinone reductase